MAANKFHHTAASQMQSPLFAKIPPELRNRIYDFALYTDGYCVITQHGGVPEPALLATCQQIRKEGVGVYYAINETLVLIDSYDCSTVRLCQRKLCSIWEDYGIDIRRVDSILTGPPSWENLKRWAQIIHEDEDVDVCGMPQISAVDAPHLKMVYGILHTAHASKATSWSEVEHILEALRFGLIAYDDRWSD